VGPRTIAFALCFVVAASGAGCGDGTSGTPPSSLVDGGRVDSGAVDSGAIDAGITPDTGPTLPPPLEPPETAAGRALAWLMGEMNGDGFTDEEIQQHFAATMLQALPAEDLRLILEERVRVMAPVTLVGVEAGHTEDQLTAFVVGRYALWHRIRLSTDLQQPQPITGLFFAPAPDLDPNRPGTWQEFTAALSEQARDVSFSASEITRGSCDQIAGLNPDLSLATGSIFKLYVLAALAQEIMDGNRSWDDQLAIKNEHKSLPSGEMHLERPGRQFPLRTYAEKMISISDNTATDHLLYELGRASVEATQSRAGHAKPALNIPFLATREFFILKLLASQADRDRYLAAEPAERRRILDEELQTIDVFEVFQQDIRWTEPMFIDQIEWFMSALDACEVMRHLREVSETAEAAPVAAILSQNPGASFDPERWIYTGFKGGSEPGVLSFTWLLQREDGRWFVLSLGLNDPDQLLVSDYGLYQAGIAAILLGAQE
jgi:beta-lactamase class A